MNYQESIEYLFSQLPMFSRTGAAAYKPGLDTSLALDEFFGHPHKKFKAIHIAGTNGKGSTSHMLASVLQEQGYKTGLYTSPHLVDFRERMRINGEMIPEEKVISFVEEWQKFNYSGHPSFFELTMMMAFNWFAEERVDYAVIEVGMGGRLDSTNLITPILSVITNISYDHNQFLGETLEAIAREKAGIIKPGIPVVIGEAEGEVRKVFEEKALSSGSRIIFAEDHPKVFSARNNKDGGWDFETVFGEIKLPLGGDYQKKNLNTLLAVLTELKEEGIKLGLENIREGISNVIKNTHLQGRWTILSSCPLIIADTGHNIAGLTYNINQLKRIQNQKNGELKFIIGFVADKAIDKILKLLPKDARYYITNASIPRALPKEKLAELFSKEGLTGECYDNVKEAYEKACATLNEKDVLFIGGSTFIVADLLS